MSNEVVPTSFSVADMRKEIECDQCETSNPSKRCSRCHLVYYCSAQCQKLHWSTHKGDCTSVEKMKNKLVGGESLSNDDTNQISSDGCAICLSETVEHPIVLPSCGHVFCFACLQQWQTFSKNSVTNRQTESRGRCPICREKIQENVVDAALEKAYLFAAAGHLSDKVYDHHIQSASDQVTENVTSDVIDERQEKFCKLAEEQVNQILMCNPTHMGALCIKGEILRYVKPHDAIEALREALRLDAEYLAKKEELNQMVAELDQFRAQMDRTMTVEEIEDDDHPMVEEWAQRVEAAEKLMLEVDKGVQINEGPFRLYRIRVWLAEAHESANEYETAEAMYKEMIQETFRLDYNDYIQIDAPTNRMIISGASRCLYRLKDYDRAKKSAEMALDMNRYFPGIHILVAQSQWALDEKKEAIRTMCRGVLYETPWDEANQERNRVYLQEFVDAMNG